MSHRNGWLSDVTQTRQSFAFHSLTHSFTLCVRSTNRQTPQNRAHVRGSTLSPTHSGPPTALSSVTTERASCSPAFLVDIVLQVLLWNSRKHGFSTGNRNSPHLLSANVDPWELCPLIASRPESCLPYDLRVDTVWHERWSTVRSIAVYASTGSRLRGSLQCWQSVRLPILAFAPKQWVCLCEAKGWLSICYSGTRWKGWLCERYLFYLWECL